MVCEGRNGLGLMKRCFSDDVEKGTCEMEGGQSGQLQRCGSVGNKVKQELEKVGENKENWGNSRQFG